MPVVNKTALRKLEASRAEHERGLLEQCARAYVQAEQRIPIAQLIILLVQHWRGADAAERQINALMRAQLTQDEHFLLIERFLLKRYTSKQLYALIEQRYEHLNLHPQSSAGKFIADTLSTAEPLPDSAAELAELIASAALERGIVTREEVSR